MARPLRVEFAGGLYHVTSRGNARQDVYADNHDRATFLSLVDRIRTRYDWYIHTYLFNEQSLPSVNRNRYANLLQRNETAERGIYASFQSPAPAGGASFPG